MIKAAMEKVLSLGKTEIVKVNVGDYTNKSVSLVEAQFPAPLTVNTLTGVIDFATSCDMGSDLIVHIADFDEVKVYGRTVRETGQRPLLLIAKKEHCKYPFGQQVPHENFIINLQANFINTETRAKILEIVGNIKSEAVAQFDDDGVTQQVSARSGIALVRDMSVPNPVKLQPFRTFIEVDQPESEFIFRLKQNSGDKPSASLYEADGGMWKLEAIANIKTLLVKNLPANTVVLA